MAKKAKKSKKSPGPVKKPVRKAAKKPSKKTTRKVPAKKNRPRRPRVKVRKAVMSVKPDNNSITGPEKKNTEKPKRPAGKAPKVVFRRRVTTVNPYLTFSGKCEEAFNFYRSVFGGLFTYIGRFGDMPSSETKGMSRAERNLIMHVSLPIGGGTTLMGCDTGGESSPTFKAGNNFSVSINAKSEGEANRLYRGLSFQGHAFMPMSKTFWGAYFGMLTDKFGVQWMISYDENQL